MGGTASAKVLGQHQPGVFAEHALGRGVTEESREEAGSSVGRARTDGPGSAVQILFAVQEIWHLVDIEMGQPWGEWVGRE